MKKELMFMAMACAGVLGSAEARADVASDRVYLELSSVHGCGGGSSGFKRVVQDPDGHSTAESTEFRVPSGNYLEITSVEVSTPHFLNWARGWVQSVDLNIVRRNNPTGSALVHSYRYMNHPTLGDSGTTFEGLDQYVSPTGMTHVASFPSGPLMSWSARLCVSASRNYWQNGGSVRVRGRLLPSDGVVIPGPHGDPVPVP